MHASTFYGSKHGARPIPDDGNTSSDSDLSTGDNEYLPPRGHSQDLHSSESSGSEEENDDPIPVNIRTKKTAGKRGIKWEKRLIQKTDDELKFLGDTTLPTVVQDLETPLQFFKHLFPDEIFKMMVTESSLYSAQCRPEKPIVLSENELQQFVGMALYMSIIQLPNTRDYWSPSLGHPKVSEIMSLNRWEELKRFIHFNDNSTFIPRGQPGHDQLHKIRPLLDLLRARMNEVPREEKLCIDEQIVPFKGRSTIKQYNPKKPHRWGYKVFVLSGVSGFCYDFEVFTGASDNVCVANEPNLGASSNVVIRLARTIPRHVGHQLFFDNWFTSIPLQVYLAKGGIHSLGTVRRNRLPGCTLPREPDMKERGRFEERVCRVDGVDVSAVAWFDNKLVTLLSTFAGSEPSGEVKRYISKEKMHKQIKCPSVVLIYNVHMGGVDLLDSMLGYYRITIRSKKWYLRLFFHMLDLTVVNAWLLFRRKKQAKLPLLEFKAAVSEGLCRAGKSCERKRPGRPSWDVEAAIQEKKKKGPAAPMPPQDVRLDRVGHMPCWSEKRQRCKLPSCNSLSSVVCMKCRAILCFNKDRNCFSLFHE